MSIVHVGIGHDAAAVRIITSGASVLSRDTVVLNMTDAVTQLTMSRPASTYGLAYVTFDDVATGLFFHGIDTDTPGGFVMSFTCPTPPMFLVGRYLLENSAEIRIACE